MNKKHKDIKQYLNKGVSTPVGILIVLLVAAAAGILIWQFWPGEEVFSPVTTSSPTSTTTPSPATDETADWKIYENEKYGYSFKYSPECQYGSWTPEIDLAEHFCYLTIENPDDISLQTNTQYPSEKEGWVLADFEVKHCSDSWDKEADSSCSPADFSNHNPPFGTELIGWLEENHGERLSHEGIPDKPNFEIGGIPAVKVLNEFPMDPPNERIFFMKNDKLFDITLWDVDSGSNRKLYDQILSTFKFID